MEFSGDDFLDLLGICVYFMEDEEEVDEMVLDIEFEVDWELDDVVVWLEDIVFDLLIEGG